MTIETLKDRHICDFVISTFFKKIQLLKQLSLNMEGLLCLVQEQTAEPHGILCLSHFGPSSVWSPRRKIQHKLKYFNMPVCMQPYYAWATIWYCICQRFSMMKNYNHNPLFSACCIVITHASLQLHANDRKKITFSISQPVHP